MNKRSCFPEEELFRVRDTGCPAIALFLPYPERVVGRLLTSEMSHPGNWLDCQQDAPDPGCEQSVLLPALPAARSFHRQAGLTWNRCQRDRPGDLVALPHPEMVQELAQESVQKSVQKRRCRLVAQSPMLSDSKVKKRTQRESRTPLGLGRNAYFS